MLSPLYLIYHMIKTRKPDKSELTGAALLGALVGAGAVLLLTPLTGKETRSIIKKKAKQLGDKTQDAVEKVRENASEVIHPDSSVNGDGIRNTSKRTNN